MMRGQGGLLVDKDIKETMIFLQNLGFDVFVMAGDRLCHMSHMSRLCDGF